MIVRTIDDTDLERLRAAGATEVVPEAIEGSLMLASHALALVGVPMRRVIRIARDARDARYGLLRGYFHGADDDTVDELQQARLLSVSLPPAAAMPRPAARPTWRCMRWACSVVSVRRAAGRGARPPTTSWRWRPATRWCCRACPEPLALAEGKLLRVG